MFPATILNGALMVSIQTELGRITIMTLSIGTGRPL